MNESFIPLRVGVRETLPPPLPTAPLAGLTVIVTVIAGKMAQNHASHATQTG